MRIYECVSTNLANDSRQCSIMFEQQTSIFPTKQTDSLYVYRSEGLPLMPLWDLLSLGAWRIRLVCSISGSGKVLTSPPEGSNLVPTEHQPRRNIVPTWYQHNTNIGPALLGLQIPNRGQLHKGFHKGFHNNYSFGRFSANIGIF